MITRRKFAKSVVLGLSGGTAGLAVTGCLGAAEPSPKLSLCAFKYAQSTISENRVYRGGSKLRRVPISFLFYMVDIDGRKILVDTGCETISGFRMEHFIAPVALLKRYGISPDDISDVIVTHAHRDHIGCVPYFGGATIHIQKDEAVAGAKYLRGLRVRPFDTGRMVGDVVEVKKIAGHSVGSSIAVIRHQGRRIVLAGDECYVRGCLDGRIPTGASRSPEKSEEFIHEYSSGDYEVHLYHDFSTLPDRNGMLKLV